MKRIGAGLITLIALTFGATAALAWARSRGKSAGSLRSLSTMSSKSRQSRNSASFFCCS